MVWGLLAAHPFGGMTWQVLHHLEGFRRLGFDVWYVEDSDRPVLDPHHLGPTQDPADNLRFLDRQMKRLDMQDRWVFRAPGDVQRCHGALDREGLASLYREADAVINLCGSHALRDEHEEIRRLVYLQTDPVADQVYVAMGEPWITGELDAHDHLFTYGANLGNPDCGVPVERFTWHPTRPPVVIDWWETDAPPANPAMTTVANWRDLGRDVVWNGETYHWRKDLELRRVQNLPARSPLPLELALEGISDDRAEELRRIGWRVVPARALTDPDAYRAYVRDSLGEFTVAKDQNVRLRSGWFSDRSACYLAAGRPVVTQDTGFGADLPTGKGLFAFTDEAEAAASIEAIAGDYAGHSSAAREIAREYFCAERVLGELVERAGLPV